MAMTATVTFGLNPGVYVDVTAPAIITITPLGPGETFPPTMTVIPQIVTPVTVPTTVGAEAHPTTSTTSTGVPWSVTFTEKR